MEGKTFEVNVGKRGWGSVEMLASHERIICGPSVQIHSSEVVSEH